MRPLVPIAAVLASLLGCTGGGTPDTPGDGYDLAAPSYGPALACSGTRALGFTRLQVGFAGKDSTAARPGLDIRYQYIAGVLAPDADCLSSTRTNAVGCGTEWWGTWQWDQDPPGAFVRNFVANAQAAGLRPMLTYYVILPASRVAEGTDEVTVAARDAAFMAAYLADFRFMLRQIGSAAAIVHVEPDFWGYAQHAANQAHTSASGLGAEVASANLDDCAGLPDTIAGLGRCFVAMARKYAPNALVSLHASGWASGFDCLSNTNPGLDVAAEAQKTADFLAVCAPTADLIVVDLADRDAGYYASIGRAAWLDATDATLPSFAQAFRWSRALHDRAGKPVLWWQLPLGNTGLPNRSGAWRDNRVEYFFAHPDRVAASGAIGMAFGAGATGQTTPETDRTLFARSAAALSAAGGQPLCP